MTDLNGAVEVLVAAAEAAEANGNVVLARNLRREVARLLEHRTHVLVVGEFKKGKSALVNALLGIPVSGVDPLDSTEIPVVVGWAPEPVAELDLEEGIEPVPVDVRSVARRGLRRTTDDDRQVRGVRVGVPRELLRRGVVLVDTPGVGGGLRSAAATATMRALTTADAVLHVTDAAQEYTAAELEFLEQALHVCPTAVLVLTKTDLHPQWRRILELDEGHLRRRGVEHRVVPVSSALRELALDTGDPALAAESGMALLTAELLNRVLPTVQGRLASAALALADQALEHLTRPEPTLEQTRRGRLGSAGVAATAQRWQYRLGDLFGELQSAVDRDLLERCERLEAQATERIEGSDPSRTWADFEEWFCGRLSEELTANHRFVLDGLDDIQSEVAGEFSILAEAVPDARDGVVPEDGTATDPRMESVTFQRAGILEMGMNAARGWSLSSSVVATLIVATLGPNLVVTLPITAVLGTAFMFRTVRGFTRNQLTTARGQASRAVALHLSRSRTHAAADNADLQRRARSRLRDFLVDRGEEAAEAARRPKAAEGAADRGTAVHRARELLDRARPTPGGEPRR